jgi:demethylmenaquinone methyltransferase/2-methoxy-6-polyprenyl-1,4-benzoquinol methylase
MKCRLAGRVSIVTEDGANLVGPIRSFDLIFPDAAGGKIFKLGKTIFALRPGRFLLVDDLDLTAHEDPDLRDGLVSVRDRLLTHPELVCADLTVASGVILGCKRRA